MNTYGLTYEHPARGKFDKCIWTMPEDALAFAQKAAEEMMVSNSYYKDCTIQRNWHQVWIESPTGAVLDRWTIKWFKLDEGKS